MKKLFIVFAFLLLPNLSLAAQGHTMLKGTAANSAISGHVMLKEAKGGITLTAEVTNVPPGKHGFHIHENGSCAEAGKAAGGHFNPDKVEHGFIPKNGHMHSHAGDMGNITINKDGKGTLKIFLEGLTLSEGKYAVNGKAIILHEKEDDFGQPTGNAGGRIGCGIIETK
jgi:Cu-Zn family superoxide dismutase